MKNGWKTRSLGDVAEVSAGDPAPQAVRLFDGGTHPFFRTSDAGRIRFGDICEATDYLNDEGIKGLRRFPKGTILFPKSGASTFLNHRVMLGVEGFVASHLAAIVADKAQIDPRFLLYFLTTISAQDMIQDHAYPSLNLPSIAGIRVLVPPLAEQKRIVGILDEAFDGIATAKANAEKNLQNTRALFQSCLNSIFSTPQGNWTQKTLEESVEQSCTLSYGIVQPGEEYERGLPVVRPTDLAEKVVRLNKLKRINPISAQAYQRTSLLGGELPLCVRGSTGLVSIASAELKGANVTRGIVPIRFNEVLVRGNFGYYLMISEAVQNQIRAKTYGAALMQINIRDVRNIAVRVPPLQEQQQIASRLDALTERTQRLESTYNDRISALRALKESLLNAAFNGAL